jgi:hypothetical protein
LGNTLEKVMLVSQTIPIIDLTQFSQSREAGQLTMVRQEILCLREMIEGGCKQLSDLLTVARSEADVAAGDLALYERSPAMDSVARLQEAAGEVRGDGVVDASGERKIKCHTYKGPKAKGK